MYVCMYVCVFMYVHVYICMCIYILVYICMRVYMYVLCMPCCEVLLTILVYVESAKVPQSCCQLIYVER
jgi:nuclear pore complex protein Nup62